MGHQSGILHLPSSHFFNSIFWSRFLLNFFIYTFVLEIEAPSFLSRSSFVRSMKKLSIFVFKRSRFDSIDRSAFLPHLYISFSLLSFSFCVSAFILLLFRLFLSFQANINTIFTINKYEKMSIQYMVLGIEPTTFGTQVSSHNH